MKTTRSSVAFVLILLLAGPVLAAVYTVGPDGSYALVQDAIEDAVLTVADDEIRLQTGTIVENVKVWASDLGGRLEISGGWDAAFAIRDATPGATTIDGNASGRVFEASFVTAGEILLRGLRLTNGRIDGSPLQGAGLYVSVTDADATIEDCLVDSNLATTTDGNNAPGGGGASISAFGTALVDLVGFQITGNEILVDDTIGASTGGGLRVTAGGTARVIVRRGLVSANEINGGSTRRAAGVYARATGSATVELEDLLIESNTVDTVSSGSPIAHGVELSVADSGTVTMRRAAITENWNGTGDTVPQVRIAPSGGTARLTDSLVARGGYGVDVESGATVFVTHLTVTDNESNGLRLSANLPATATATNNICWANGSSADLSLLGDGSTGVSNLVGSDPMFVDAPSGDYHLDALSPAIDGGTASPADGLGSFDIEHGPRVVGALPDQGASERGSIHADDFERGDLRFWSAAAP